MIAKLKNNFEKVIIFYKKIAHFKKKLDNLLPKF